MVGSQNLGWSPKNLLAGPEQFWKPPELQSQKAHPYPAFMPGGRGMTPGRLSCQNTPAHPQLPTWGFPGPLIARASAAGQTAWRQVSSALLHCCVALSRLLALSEL